MQISLPTVPTVPEQQRGEHQFHNVILTDDGAGYILLEGGNHHAEIGHNTLLLACVYPNVCRRGGG